MVGVGIVGAGYWGPKHVRNFSELSGARVAMVSDLSETRLAALGAQYPGVLTTTDHRELLGSAEVEAVVVATPVSTHARLAREALLAGKHVLVEKPLAASSRECEELIRLAAGQGKVLMVGHTFLYNPAVLLLRDLVVAGEIGEVYFAHAQRLNLGLFQRDINVLWDLAPHDLSILMYVLGMDPTAIAARGRAHVFPAIEDVAYMDITFSQGVGASVHVSWLHPNKVRRLTLVGSKKMVVYDDAEPVDKIRVYDKGVDISGSTGRLSSVQLSYRDGASTTLPVTGTEPLRLECQHFLDCIETGCAPRTDGVQGWKVVRALELANLSLADGGVSVPLSTAVDWAGVAPHRAEARLAPAAVGGNGRLANGGTDPYWTVTQPVAAQ